MSIFIFSRPIHSGKTTELLQWCNLQKNIHGILMPDIDGSRKILNIKTKEVFDIECADPAATKEALTIVGRFSFYTAAFDKANAVILDALALHPDWLIIDEAGKLELEGKGFYKSVQNAASLYNGKNVQGDLLITVRDSLCAEVISFFNFKDAVVIQNLEDIPTHA
jgi:nucleoside-triphosphatase